MAALTPAPVRPSSEILGPFIHAAAIPGVGPVSLKKAVRSPHGPAAGLGALISSAETKLDERELDRVYGWVRRIMETIHRDRHHVLIPELTWYPDALEHLEEPPYPLFARGRLELLDSPTVAIVGTRAMTGYGRESAHRLAAGVAAAGATVVSGLARGVDGVAHRAAGPARTVGVVGCGLDVAFPTAHTELQEAIGREGLLLGELLPGTPPARHAFPKRNRIIAAIARAVIVVEAPHGSGALSTAAQAREQGKDVFAVPGPIWSRASEGTNALIRDGVHMVTAAREVVAELGLPEPPPGAEKEVPPPELEGQALALWRVLGREPKHADEVAALAGLDPRRGLASLLSLELQGHARQVAGMRFCRG
ncbi:MAG: DNA-processing protein DprA [Longimicrobiales bacterium]